MPQTRVLTLNKNQNNESVLFRLEKGSIINLINVATIALAYFIFFTHHIPNFVLLKKCIVFLRTKQYCTQFTKLHHPLLFLLITNFIHSLPVWCSFSQPPVINPTFTNIGHTVCLIWQHMLYGASHLLFWNSDNRTVFVVLFLKKPASKTMHCIHFFPNA